MPSASTLTPDKRFFALFVGESKSGKTVAEASFPKPIHVMEFDGRIRGLLGAPWIKRDEITYTPYTPKQPNLIGTLNSELDGMLGLAIAGRLPTNTLCTDSITSLNHAFITQSIPLTHTGSKGRWIGPIAMAGMEDYGLEAQATYDYIAFMKSLPITNVIVSAHVIPTYGKEDPDNPFSPNVVTGEKLSIREKIAANIAIHFDHVFRFEVNPARDKYFVTFRGGLASTSYAELPSGKIDITGKSLYEVMMGYIQKGKNA